VALTLGAYGSVRGRVRFEDASVPPEFSIGSALTSSTFSHPSGEFRLDNMAPGDHHLYLTGPQFVNDMLPRVVTITSGQAADIGEIVVKRGRSITGTVKRDGRPVAGATVSVTPLLVGNGTRPEPSFLTKTALTAADGKFRIDGVHKAPVPIMAWHSTAGRSPAVRIPVGDGDASMELNLNPTGALRGEVYCGATPVSAIVSVGDPDDKSLFSTTSSPDVGYRLDTLAPGRHDATAVLLHPRNSGCAGSRTLSVEITAGTTSTLSFTFEP
jgi:hypothetical protein